MHIDFSSELCTMKIILATLKQIWKQKYEQNIAECLTIKETKSYFCNVISLIQGGEGGNLPVHV